MASKRHIVAVSSEEWEQARQIGEAQPVPVSPSAVLRAAIKIFLDMKRQEAQGESHNRRRKPSAMQCTAVDIQCMLVSYSCHDKQYSILSMLLPSAKLRESQIG